MVPIGAISSLVAHMIRFAKGGGHEFAVFEIENQTESLEIIQNLDFDIANVSHSGSGGSFVRFAIYSISECENRCEHPSSCPLDLN